jgi:hypothetical protein
MSTREDIALCLGRSISCQAEQVISRLQPRAFELFQANGYPTLLPTAGLHARDGTGDATGFDGAALLACKRPSRSRAHATRRRSSRAPGVHGREPRVPPAVRAARAACLDPLCVERRQHRCDKALQKIAAAGTKKIIGIQRGCTALDAAGIPALRRASASPASRRSARPSRRREPERPERPHRLPRPQHRLLARRAWRAAWSRAATRCCITTT